MPKLREEVVMPRHRRLAELKRPGRDRALALAGLLLCSFSIVWCIGVALRLIAFYYHVNMSRGHTIACALMAWVFLFLIGRALFLGPEKVPKQA